MAKNFAPIGIFLGFIIGHLAGKTVSFAASLDHQAALSVYSQKTSQSFEPKGDQPGLAVKTLDTSLRSAVRLGQTIGWSPVESLTLTETYERDQSIAGAERLQSGGLGLVYRKAGDRSRMEFFGAAQGSRVVDPTAATLAVQSELAISNKSPVWTRSESAGAIYGWNLSPTSGFVGKIDGNRTLDQAQPKRSLGVSLEAYKSLDALTTLRLESGYKRDLEKTGFQASSLVGTLNKGLTRQWQGTLALGMDHVEPNHQEAQASGEGSQQQAQESTNSVQGRAEATGRFALQTLILSARRGLQRRPVSNSLILADSYNASWGVAARDSSESMTIAASTTSEADILVIGPLESRVLKSLEAEYSRSLFSRKGQDTTVFSDRISVGMRLEESTDSTQTLQRSVMLLGYLIQL